MGSLWLLAQFSVLQFSSSELRIVMLSPGGDIMMLSHPGMPLVAMEMGKLCSQFQCPLMWSIPTPSLAPFPQFSCLDLPAPRVLLLGDVPEELPVERRRLEKEDCIHANMDLPTCIASTPRQMHHSTNSKRKRIIPCANICKTVSTPCK